MINCIRYRGGYKYQLCETYVIQTSIRQKRILSNAFLRLDQNGLLTIREGYAWDGPSGPTYDSPNAMRGSLVHDALYQLMREGLLDPAFRDEADNELYRICLEDGMNTVRAWVWYRAVQLCAGPCADPKRDRPVIVAPKETA